MIEFAVGITFALLITYGKRFLEKSGVTLVPVTKKESDKYWGLSHEWLYNRTPHNKLGNKLSYDAKRVIAEYMANCDGKTMGDI